MPRNAILVKTTVKIPTRPNVEAIQKYNSMTNNRKIHIFKHLRNVGAISVQLTVAGPSE